MSDDSSKLFPATGMPDADWWQTLWPDPMAVLAKTGFKPGMTAVDLCCGDGLFTLPMSQLLSGNVVAVDLDPDMIAKAKSALSAANAPDCTWVEGDARDMIELVKTKVDVVLIANTFHGVPEQTALAQAAADVLKVGGALVIINWRDLPREETVVLGQARGPRTDLRMSPSAVTKVVEPTGLTFDTTVELPPYHYGAVFRK